MTSTVKAIRGVTTETNLVSNDSLDFLLVVFGMLDEVVQCFPGYVLLMRVPSFETFGCHNVKEYSEFKVNIFFF